MILHSNADRKTGTGDMKAPTIILEISRPTFAAVCTFATTGALAYAQDAIAAAPGPWSFQFFMTLVYLGAAMFFAFTVIYHVAGSLRWLWNISALRARAALEDKR